MSDHSQPTGGGYETRDENFKAIVLLTILLIVVVAASAIFSWFIDRWMRTPTAAGNRPVSPLADLHRLPPEPLLQVNDAVDMVAMRNETQAILTSYGWLDTEAGTVRIPIDRAMELIAERGLPARKASAEAHP